MNRNLVRHFFLTSKPYSYAGEVSRGILYSLILLPDNKILAIYISASISFLMWLYFNWQSDYIQQDTGRFRPPKLLFLIPLFITLYISFYFGGLEGLFGIILYALSIILYSYKAKNSILGVLGPFLRLLNGISLFIAVAFSLRLNITIDALFVALIVSLYLAIRNLIGDVRDIKKDKWEFPARFGGQRTTFLIRLLFLVLFSLCLFAGVSIVPYFASAIVLISWILLELLVYKFGYDRSDLWGYVCHRILVMLVAVFHLALIYPLYRDYTLYLVIVILILITQPLYYFLPSKAFPKLRELFNC